MPEFKYAIGDLLCVRGQVKNLCTAPHRSLVESPALFHVMERITQECPGGTQLKYLCFITNGSDCGAATGILLQEHLLMPIEEAEKLLAESRKK